MIAALLLAAQAAAAAPAPQTAIDAERAFAADAQKLGQWTAFRKWAAPGAKMFVPEAVYAQEWLRTKQDPPQSVRWQPAASYLSCDGKVAINEGPWQRPDGSFGYFTTVWLHERLRDGPRWHWVYDAGDVLKVPMQAPGEPVIRRASCDNLPSRAPGLMRYSIPTLPSPDAPVPQQAELHSSDRSLIYDYSVSTNGARTFSAWFWNGRGYEPIVHREVAAAPQ